MPTAVTFGHEDGPVLIVVDEAMPSPAASVQRSFNPNPADPLARSGGFPAPGEALVGKVTLDDAVKVVARLSEAFSKALAGAVVRPSEVEIEFGLEASAELGGLLVGKASGKANFNVKMTWKTASGGG
jgi:hypothetical protein